MNITEIKKMLEEYLAFQKNHPCSTEFWEEAPSIIAWLVSEVEMHKAIGESLMRMTTKLESENSQLRLDLLTAQSQANGEYEPSTSAQQLIEESVSKWISAFIEPIEHEWGFELKAKNIQSLYDFCEEALKKAQQEAVENYKKEELSQLKKDHAVMREALEFYGNEENWKYRSWDRALERMVDTFAEIDKVPAWHKAKEAIKEVGEK